MMDDIEKTKPVDGAPADDDETGAGCDVCMPPVALVGAEDYDYKYLCMPSMPWSKGGVEPPQFLAKDEKLPLTLSLISGLQHALAMVAGIATSGGTLIAGDACFAWQKDSEMCESREYMVSAAWITSGILTIIQVFRAKILGTGFYLGTGLISVMGTSFTFLPIAREMVIRSITDARAEGKCECTPGTADDGSATCGFPFDCKGYGKEGYGKFLGTAMVAAFVEVVIALMPSKMRQKLFPPVVTGVSVMLIGASLITAGIKYVGGGVFCAENDLGRSAAFGGPQLCNENGNVILPFGSPEYVGLAFSVIFMSVFLQFFGSPFLKSTFLFWGLMFGCFVAGISTYEGKGSVWDSYEQTFSFSKPDDKVIATQGPMKQGRQYKYFNNYRIRNAPWFTFLWAETFPLGFAPEYFFPILIGFFVSTAETIGDVTSSCIGIGVAMEPNLFEGGGVASFYGKNLQHNTGFWPRYKTCKTFPVDSETGAQVRTCTNNNGACCSEYDKGEDSNRTAAIILLKTPYSIGFVVALFLHLLLPEDKEEEEEEDSGKEMKVDPVEA